MYSVFFCFGAFKRAMDSGVHNAHLQPECVVGLDHPFFFIYKNSQLDFGHRLIVNKHCVWRFKAPFRWEINVPTREKGNRKITKKIIGSIG